MSGEAKAGEGRDGTQGPDPPLCTGLCFPPDLPLPFQTKRPKSLDTARGMSLYEEVCEIRVGGRGRGWGWQCLHQVGGGMEGVRAQRGQTREAVGQMEKKAN